MNIEELKNLLDEKGISPNRYSLNGGLENDTLCIEKVFCKWVVYYTERGNKYNEKSFLNENDACEYFYKLLAEDCSTMFGENSDGC